MIGPGCVASLKGCAVRGWPARDHARSRPVSIRVEVGKRARTITVFHQARHIRPMARGGEGTDAVDWTRQIAVFVLLFFAGLVAMIPSTSVSGNTYHPYAYLGWILIGISLLALVGPFYRTLLPVAPKARSVVRLPMSTRSSVPNAAFGGRFVPSHPIASPRKARPLGRDNINVVARRSCRRTTLRAARAGASLPSRGTPGTGGRCRAPRGRRGPPRRYAEGNPGSRFAPRCRRPRGRAGLPRTGRGG